jgi:hypothetical protein
MHAEFRAKHRDELKRRLANESDNYARDLMREALKRKDTDYEPVRHSKLFSEAMEMNASNREGEWRRGERERK